MTSRACIYQQIFNFYLIICGLVTSVTIINSFISFPCQPYLGAIFKIKKLIAEAFFLIFSQGIEIKIKKNNLETKELREQEGWKGRALNGWK